MSKNWSNIRMSVSSWKYMNCRRSDISKKHISNMFCVNMPWLNLLDGLCASSDPCKGEIWLNHLFKNRISEWRCDSSKQFLGRNVMYVEYTLYVCMYINIYIYPEWGPQTSFGALSLKIYIKTYTTHAFSMPLVRSGHHFPPSKMAKSGQNPPGQVVRKAWPHGPHGPHVNKGRQVETCVFSNIMKVKRSFNLKQKIQIIKNT